MDTDHGSAAPTPSSPTEQTDQSGKFYLKPRSQPEQPKSNTSAGIKRDARAAELPDEDEQGGKCQQVEGFTTVNEETIPCEFSVEDDFVIDENAEGVDEEIVKAIVGWQEEKRLTRWKHLESLTCAKNSWRMRRSSQRDGETFQKVDEWRCRFVAAEFGHDDPEMEGHYTSGSTAATGRLDIHSCASVRKTRTSMLRKMRKSTVGLQKNGSSGIIREVVEWKILGGS